MQLSDEVTEKLQRISISSLERALARARHVRKHLLPRSRHELPGDSVPEFVNMAARLIEYGEGTKPLALEHELHQQPSHPRAGSSTPERRRPLFGLAMYWGHTLCSVDRQSARV